MTATASPMMLGPMEMNPGVNAVILSGGGANGAYEVGVLKALCGGASPATGFKPLKVEIAAGTSIGAFNAGVLVSRLWQGGLVAATEVEDIWLNLIPKDDSTNHNHIFRFRGDPTEFFNLQLIYKNPLAPVRSMAGDAASFFYTMVSSISAMAAPGTKSLEGRIASAIDFSALIDNEPSMRLVQKCVDPRSIRESHTKLRIASTNWDAGEVRVFTNADLTDDYAHRMVLSSTAIPGLFPPVMIDGVTYVDGGVILNTPTLPALKAGADTVHVVYLDPAVSAIPLGALNSTMDSMTRMFVVQFASRMNEDIKRIAMINRGVADIEAAGKSAESGVRLKRVTSVNSLKKIVVHRYHPREDLGQGILGWLDFSRERNQRLIDRGFRDAVEHDCYRSECVTADGTMFPQNPDNA